jgi:hypothetical protein
MGAICGQNCVLVTIAFADDKEFKQKMITSEKPTYG